jgi:hypothetical protein
MRTRTLKTNIAILRGVLAGGLPGTGPIRSERVAAAMAQRLELFCRELAFRDQHRERTLEGRTVPKAPRRSQPMSAQAMHEKLSVLESRGVRVIVQ